MIPRKYEGQPAIILGTGPSLNEQADAIRDSGYLLFGINNTYSDFDLAEWIACDPQWHKHYGAIEGDFGKWHWDKDICDEHGYEYVEGRWLDGLSLDQGYISFNHSSGAQALNLAVLMGCNPIYLAGFDMKYKGPTRHYFTGLSEDGGEYPANLRKTSSFEGLIGCYNKMLEQIDELPTIINLTQGSGLKVFKFGTL